MHRIKISDFAELIFCVSKLGVKGISLGNVGLKATIKTKFIANNIRVSAEASPKSPKKEPKIMVPVIKQNAMIMAPIMVFKVAVNLSAWLIVIEAVTRRIVLKTKIKR